MSEKASMASRYLPASASSDPDFQNSISSLSDMTVVARCNRYVLGTPSSLLQFYQQRTSSWPCFALWFRLLHPDLCVLADVIVTIFSSIITRIQLIYGASVAT